MSNPSTFRRRQNRGARTRSVLSRGALLASWSLLAAVLIAPTAGADGGVTFTDIADNGGAGVGFARTPSPRLQIKQDVFDQLPLPAAGFIGTYRPITPLKAWGQPGVVLFDYDNDGDEDIYVTNGPGTPNSLYSNQLQETGSLSFVDVAQAAGVAATAADGSAVCSGDIDNDGDADLYVTSTGEGNLLFENNGNGTFRDITDATVAGDGRHPSGCSLGDFDNDGLLDIYVGNTYDDWNHRMAIFAAPGPTYAGMEHNVLLRNLGGNRFADVSQGSGVETVSNMSGPGLTGGGFTWAVGAADYDLDGDLDIFNADNQGNTATQRSEERGWIRVFQNDGSGSMTDVTETAGLDVVGGWMGLAFADFNCDRNMDLFATNLGNYIGGPTATSAIYTGNGDGTFSFAGPSEPNVFGWGTSAFDYDNDGDSDLIYHGGVDLLNAVNAGNPGVLYTNQGLCSGQMVYDADALSVDHRKRTVHGVATGDLDNDGFDDIVSAANFRFEPNQFFLPLTFFTGDLGSVFDDIASFQNILSGIPMPGFVVEADPDLELQPGNLSVEINSADNGNHWLQVKTRGSVGDTRDGGVNRDGIGAVVQFTPHDGPTSMRVVSGGESHASQNSRVLGFGLGGQRFGTVDVLWPGGVRNRLYFASHGERIVFPEIPCSIDTGERFPTYIRCVNRALRDLQRSGAISSREKGRFKVSAIFAYFDEH